VARNFGALKLLNKQMTEPTEHPIIFYDGVCGLCDRSIQFIMLHDKKKVFRFAALQSEFAAKTLGENLTFDSFIYYHKEKHFTGLLQPCICLKCWEGAGVFYMDL
jgi:hypothetical protein